MGWNDRRETVETGMRGKKEVIEIQGRKSG